MVNKKYIISILLGALVLGGCEDREKSSLVDLNQIQTEFLQQITKEGIEESPFHLQYTLQTVFFSSEVISLFGEVQAYDSPPASGWKRYEGKTLCKIGGSWKEVLLADLFPLEEQMEFLRKYCELNLKYQPLSYFAGSSPLRDHLEYQEVAGFILGHKGLVLFFQPYVVGRASEVPFYVTIPYEYLDKKWNALHPLPSLLSKVFSAHSYTAHWNEFIENFSIQ